MEGVPLLRDMLIPPFIKDGQHRSKGFTFPSFRPSVHRFFFLPFSYCTYLKVMCPTSNVSRRLDGPNFNGLIAFLRFRGASDGRRLLNFAAERVHSRPRVEHFVLERTLM